VNSVEQVDYFHFGIIVDRLDVSMEDLSRRFCLEWRTVAEIRRTMYFDQCRESYVELSSVYTVQGPPFIELIQEVPGSLWTKATEGLVHHLGFSSSCLPEVCREFEESGLRRVVSDGLEAEAFAYYSIPYGPYIEIMTTDARARRGL
jgi:Glyoxalase/Bleomycin resistance protein/Dioxygenase superfamily